MGCVEGDVLAMAAAQQAGGGQPVAAHLPLAGDSSEGSSRASSSTHEHQLSQQQGHQLCDTAEQEQEHVAEHHHHLLRHCLNTEQRQQALEHFSSPDVREAAREIGRMGQRELQLKFKLVYGNATHSNNNNWLRRKLYEAIGAAPLKVTNKASKSRKVNPSRSTKESSPPALDRLTLRCHHSAGAPEQQAEQGGCTHAARTAHQPLSLPSSPVAMRPRSPRGVHRSVARPRHSSVPARRAVPPPPALAAAAPGALAVRPEHYRVRQPASAPPRRLPTPPQNQQYQQREEEELMVVAGQHHAFMAGRPAPVSAGQLQALALDGMLVDQGFMDSSTDGWLLPVAGSSGGLCGGRGDEYCWDLLGEAADMVNASSNNLLGFAMERGQGLHKASQPSSPAASGLEDDEDEVLLLPVDPFAMDAFAFM